MAYQYITLEKKDGIATLTLNRPPVNVMNLDTINELTAAFEELDKDGEVKVLLVKGGGTRAFCAGVEVKDHVGAQVMPMMTGFEKMIRALKRLGKPSIAVVNGVALGGGCELVAACDMAIASEKAELGQPEIKLGGLAPAAAALFPKIMGEKKAFEMILLGDNVKARDAEHIGLVNMVVTPEELDATADRVARKFLAISGLSLKLLKEAFYAAGDSADFNAAIRKATELGIRSWQTEDAQEGLKAFLEKRPPVWKNR